MSWSMDQDNLRSTDSISDNNPPHGDNNTIICKIYLPQAHR